MSEYMRKVGVKEFRNYMRKNLRELPFLLTREGRIVAVVVDREFFEYLLEHAKTDSGK
jgi:hypothetical protein